jgi:peptide/nickel transport system substrate-binding protein
MGWNLRDGRFGDPAVRRASAHAVDVEALINTLTLRQGDWARGPFVPASGYADTTSVLPHDVELAKAILERAGWRDENGDGVRERRGARLAFFILTPEDDALRVEAAQQVSKQLAAAGISARVRTLPNLDFLSRIDGHDFEAYMGHWYPDLHGDLSPVWHSETARFNYGGYANPTVDSLLALLRYEEADTWRRQAETELQRRIYADQPVLFLFQVPRFAAFSRRVRGYRPNVLSTFWNLPEWWIPRDEQRHVAAP